MSNFAVSPSMLVTVTLTPYVLPLIFMSQFIFAPTVAFNAFGQDTESGLFPAGSVIFWLIWLSTSVLLTVLGPDEHPAVPISNPARAHGMSSTWKTDFAIVGPPVGRLSSSCSATLVG